LEFIIIVVVIIGFIYWNSRPQKGDSKPSWLTHLEEIEAEPMVKELRKEVEELTDQNERLAKQVDDLERELDYCNERLDKYEKKYGYE
jgi:predicted  nucleic acid-binding Zn-ribbon protein